MNLLEGLINLLGRPIKISGNEYYWQCPECRDSGRDNLKYNTEKCVLTCFNDTDHSHYLWGKIVNNAEYKLDNTARNPTKPVYIPPVLTHEILGKYYDYTFESMDYLQLSKRALDFLLQKRGIRAESAYSLGIGFDKKAQKWVFPVFSEKGICGFEFRNRSLDRASTHKLKGTAGNLGNRPAEINFKNHDTRFFICLEGFLDAYLFWQYLCDKNKVQYYHVHTPLNGIGDAYTVLKNFDYGKYQKAFLYLDSDRGDKPGQLKGVETMLKLKDQNPCLELIIMDCGCKDWTEHFMSCKAKNRIDSNKK